ncbi:hypothetical protein [Sphingomonas glacialis]|uniref:hypothetical protein n=1 Tax=Sphingomonas glacialis TaxID=658225 RepID=UPI001386A4A2|nr:hypothetical protein [Sphingomonas glacialis]
MAYIRNKLKSGDIWVDWPSAYRRFDSYFASLDASEPITAGLLKTANRFQRCL